MSIDKGFTNKGLEKEPHAFIQWRGTDVCMDFYCDCGRHGHYDGDFAYTVKCPGCNQVWEMPWNLFPRKVDENTTDKYSIESAKVLD